MGKYVTLVAENFIGEILNGNIKDGNTQQCCITPPNNLYSKEIRKRVKLKI